MPWSVVVSVEILWGRPGTRTCGIPVGRAEAFGGSSSRSLRDLTRASRAGSPPGPRGWLPTAGDVLAAVPR
jgi:hypothetical protein